MGQQIAQAAGFGLGALNTIQALRSGQLQNQMTQRALALANPEIRAGLVNSPFTAGTLFVGGGQRALPTIQPQGEAATPPGPWAPGATQVQVPQQFGWTPNLPPLSPETQLKQEQARAGLALQQYDPTTFRVANDAGTPEDVGQIIQRAGPQGIQNISARTGGLGMFQLSFPGQYVDLGNGQYGIVDERGGVRSVGAMPGAAADAAAQGAIARQRAGRARIAGTAGGGGVRPLSGEGGTVSVPTTKKTYKVPADMQAAADVTAAPQTPTTPYYLQAPTTPAQTQPTTTTPPPGTPPQPTNTYQGSAVPFAQIDLNAPLSAVIQQPNQTGYPSGAPQAAVAPPAPTSSAQQATPYQLPEPAPGQLQPPGPVYNPFLGEEPGFSPAGTSVPGGPVTGIKTTDAATGTVATQTPTGPKLDPMQVKAYALNGSPDLTKLTPEGARYLLDQDKIAEQRKAENAALLQGLASEEIPRISSMMAMSDALSELRWMGPGIYDYIGKKYSLAGAQRGVAGLSVYGDPGYEHVKSIISQIRLLAFTFGGQQLTDTEAKRVDAIIPQMDDSPAAFKIKAARVRDILSKQIEILLAGRGAKIAPSAVQHLQEIHQRINIIPPSETPQ